MDVGTFVLDAGSVRWICDLGMQEYHSLESACVNLWDGRQGGSRWKVFRLGPASHNIVRIGDAEQIVSARASLVFSQPAGTIVRATIDLAALYAPVARTLTRQADVYTNGTVVIEDRWRLTSQTAVTIQLITARMFVLRMQKSR